MRKEIHSGFAKFLKLWKRCLCFLTLYLCGQVFRSFLFPICGESRPPPRVAYITRDFCELLNRNFSSS